MEGKKFNRWTVLQLIKIDKPGKHYECRCDCGNKEIKVATELRRGKGTSCSSCNPRVNINPLEEIGKKYGDWLVLEIAQVPQTKVVFRYFKCQCKCGYIKNVRSVDLRNGKSTQCRSCREKEFHINTDSLLNTKVGKWKIIQKVPTKNNLFLCECECGKQLVKSASILKNKKSLQCHLCNVRKHGYDNTRTYKSWNSMRERCRNTNKENYHLYGGRGITICERWEKFENFLEDMGERPENKEIDRIDTNGNYEPGNCRWVTKSENALNRRPRKKRT